jgi:carboxypeptidase family protein
MFVSCPRWRKLNTLAQIALSLGVLSTTLFSQEFRATLTGRVTDPSGSPVPGITVQVRNAETNEIANSLTDTQGGYTVPLLRPGVYSVSVEAPGFKKYTGENIRLNVGQSATVNVALELGQVTDTITVTAETALLETSKSDRGSVIDNQQVREFPLNARNPFMLSLLVAGVNFNGNAIYQRPFDNGAIAEWTVNGSQSHNNEFLLDGAPNNSQAGGNNIALVPSVDAVQEFKIQTNSYDAQYGHTGGGIINVSLKSGTNGLHGSLYEFARRSPLDANSFQNNARSVPRNDDHGHFLDQYGIVASGPIVLPKLYNGRDQSFFMVSYEGYREGTPTPLTLSVLEPEMLQGDFSKLVDSKGQKISIYDPTTGRDVNGVWTRDPFPGAKIPRERINPIAQRILAYQPKPNTTTPGQGYSSSNLFIPEVDRDDFYNLGIKLDQNIAERHRVFFRHASNDRTEIRHTNGVKGAGEDGPLPLKRVNDAYVID